MAWLSGWAADQRIKATIDNTKIDEAFTDFPALVRISDAAGINSKNLTDFFDKLAYTLTGDDFTGTNSDPPDTDRWLAQSGYTINHFTIQSNKLDFSSDEATNTDERALSQFKINNDFDTQVDFSTGTIETPVSINQLVRILLIPEVGIGSTDYVSIAWQKLTDGTFVYRMLDGVSGGTNDVTTSTSGKFRITRSGSVLKGYVWENSQWEWNGNTSGYTFGVTTTSELRVRLDAFQVATYALNFDYDNFLINSGTVVWPQGSHPNRKKIAITKDDGTTEQKVEVDIFDAVGEKAYLHTKVPSISASIDTILYLYYDAAHAANTANVGDPGDTPAQAVWDADFITVLHFSDNDIINSIDSTLNGLDGADANTVLGSYYTGFGKFKIVNLGLADQKIEIADNALLRGLTDLTVEVRGKVNSEVDWFKILDYASDVTQNAGRKYRIYLNNEATRKVGFQICDTAGNPFVTHEVSYSFNIWTMFAMTLKGGTGDAEVKSFLDGVRQAFTDSLTGTLNNDSSGDVVLGRDNYNNLYQGAMAYDEIRISKATRSEAWLKATYKSAADDLITFGEPGIANVISNEVIHSALFGGLVVR